MVRWIDGCTKYTIEQLKELYTPIVIYSSSESIGHGTRYLFWVAGDGKQTLFYMTDGNPVVLKNEEFTFISVHGANSSVIKDGRIAYTPREGDRWKDVGPITISGRLPKDTSIKSAKRALLNNSYAEPDKDERGIWGDEYDDDEEW